MQEFFESIVVSDIHLGSELCQSKLLNQFLQKLITGELKTNELILNGDVFDSWDFRRLKKTHWKILSDIRKLSDKIKVTWIVGNHDSPSELISHLIGVEVCEDYKLVSNNKIVFITHGDRYDNFIEKYPLITEIACFLYYLLQKVDPTLKIALKTKKASKIFLRCANQIETKAISYCLKKSYDTVICGHVHLSTNNYHGPIQYVNSGSWQDTIPTYVTILNGKVELHEFNKPIIENKV